jgi:hypothetical protein
MLPQHCLVVAEQRMKRVSELVCVIIARRCSANLATYSVRPLTKRVESISLNQNAGKPTIGMPQHC